MADLQVDAWGALVFGAGAAADTIKQKVIEGVEAAGLGIEQTEEYLAMNDPLIVLGGQQQLPYIVFKQSLGSGSVARLALRIAPRGNNDLELAWRLTERNRTTEFLWLGVSSIEWWFGLIFLIVGLITGVGIFCFGPLAIYLFGRAAGWWGAKKRKTTLSTYAQVQSRMLAVTVDGVLMRALDHVGVEPHQLREALAANTQGIGRLGATRDPL
jgi:hypothetical protein